MLYFHLIFAASAAALVVLGIIWMFGWRLTKKGLVNDRDGVGFSAILMCFVTFLAGTAWLAGHFNNNDVNRAVNHVNTSVPDATNVERDFFNGGANYQLVKNGITYYCFWRQGDSDNGCDADQSQVLAQRSGLTTTQTKKVLNEDGDYRGSSARLTLADGTQRECHLVKDDVYCATGVGTWGRVRNGVVSADTPTNVAP